MDDSTLGRLLDLLDASDEETVGTSVRMPTALRDAAVLATSMGLADSTTDLAIRGLRDVLGAVAQRALLEAHYSAHPLARPDLVEIALAAAEIDGNPLAERPELLRHAASAVSAIRDNATADDVLLYAAGMAAAA